MIQIASFGSLYRNILETEAKMSPLSYRKSINENQISHIITRWEKNLKDETSLVIWSSSL